MCASSCDSRFHSERSERNDDKQILNTLEKGTSLSVFQSNKQARTHSDEMNSGDRSPVFVCSPSVWLRPNNPRFVPWKWSRTSVHELKEICREIFFPFQKKILPHFFSGDPRKMFFYSDTFWFISFWLVTKIFKANAPLAPVGCLYCSSSYLITKGSTLKLVVIHSELFL